MNCIATVRFAFTIPTLEDAGAALRRLQMAAESAGFEMRDGTITPATPTTTADAWTGYAPLPPEAH